MRLTGHSALTRIGITGHQKLASPDQWQWVIQQIRLKLSSVPRPHMAITCLAKGADQIFARLIIEEGGAVYAVLPFRDIERTFSSKDLPEFKALLKLSRVEVLVETSTDDEEAFFAAGKRVVDLCDTLFAVWNGKPARGKGGTADVVDYAKKVGRETLHFNPVDSTVRSVERL